MYIKIYVNELEDTSEKCTVDNQGGIHFRKHSKTLMICDSNFSSE